jgi:hypothetical protein
MLLKTGCIISSIPLGVTALTTPFDLKGYSGEFDAFAVEDRALVDAFNGQSDMLEGPV